MNPVNYNYVTIRWEVIQKAVNTCGVNCSKISSMVLNRDESYLSSVKKRGTMVETDLKRLCDFLSLNIDNVIVKEPEVSKEATVTPTPKEVVNLDALIVGINNLYQIEKLNSEAMQTLIEQTKVVNTKLSRLENLIGQMHANEIAIKEGQRESINYLRDTKSSVVTISGRVRDMLAKFK